MRSFGRGRDNVSHQPAAAGLALINAVANVGSFAGPFFIGWVKDHTGNFSLGIVALGLGPLAAAVVAATLRSVRKFAPAAGPATG